MAVPKQTGCSPPWGNVSQQSLCQPRWQRKDKASDRPRDAWLSLLVSLLSKASHMPGQVPDHFDDRNLLNHMSSKIPFCSSTQLGFWLYLWVRPHSRAAPWPKYPQAANGRGASSVLGVIASQKKFPNISCNRCVCTFFVNWGVGLIPDSSITSHLPGSRPRQRCFLFFLLLTHLFLL